MQHVCPITCTFNSCNDYTSIAVEALTIISQRYLHSSIVKFRSGLGNSLGDISEIPEEPDTDSLMVVDRRKHLKQTLHFTYIDSLFALTFALLANSSILIIAAAQLQADKEVSELSDAYALLEQSLGTSAAVLFAFALLCAGQSSTITGTLAGQYVMVGFLGDSFRIAPWLRRLITRSLAIIPALVIVSLFGDAGLNKLLVFSQVILSLQLPFAVWPLVHFTSRKDVMTVRIAKATPNISEPSLQDQDPDFPATRLQPVASTIQIEDQVEEVSYQSPLHFTIVMVMVALIITSFNIVLLIEIGQDGIQ